MRASERTIRTIAYLILATAISAALVACGGGGGGTTSSLSGGQTSASLSVASAPAYPAGTTFATSTASPAGTSAPPDSTPAFDHVWVTVTKVALIPADGDEYPDRDGETEMMDSAGEGGISGLPGFVTYELPSPVVFDLLHPPTGRQVARVLNRFPDIPAGEYSKIRVYYSKVEGETSDNTFVPFHATAHYHFDVHFVGGNLVVPVATDPTGGIRFYRIRIHVVGLKIHTAGNSGNVLLRPQVFATVDPADYIVSGTADNVNAADNTFDILTPGGTVVPAGFGAGTDWIYIDDTVIPSVASSAAGDVLGPSGLRNGAIVAVIGTFSPDRTLLAEEVDITFPDVLMGKVFVGWSGDTFSLRDAGADNTVFPMPSRAGAYYDNAADLSRLSDANITDNATITARGYKVTGGIDAYWISIGSPVIPR